jgi:TrmH family RNA methyltransferase
VSAAARITSRQHAVVRRFREAARGNADVVLLDGEHLLAEALDAGVALEVVLTDGRAAALAGRARAAGAMVYEAAATVLEAASPVRTPTGIVALARWAPCAVTDALHRATGTCLGLVGVQDPGNVGSAIRAADALGASAILALDDTADPSGWKVLRGSMGSTFHFDVARGRSTEALACARTLGWPIIATVTEGGTSIERANLSVPALVLVGSEGGGLPAEIVSLADQRVTIPMRPGANSLNVAVTAAILLFELRRQKPGQGLQRERLPVS